MNGRSARIQVPLYTFYARPLDGSTNEKGRARRGWAAAEARLREGMRALTHVEGCGEHWEAWADEAVGFVRWWRKKYDAARGEAARAALGREARAKFGSLYRDYCREAGLPGGENR